MKLSKLVLALGMAGVLVGAANAAAPKTNNQVSKKITLTAQINDGIFVSKPDGSTWYTTEELEAEDFKQLKFHKELPIRVWTKNPKFNVSLSQPLMMSNGHYAMKNAKVAITSQAGDSALEDLSVKTITQVAAIEGGYDEIHNLKISVDAPTKATGEGALSTNGSYSGDLVMLFEPAPTTP